MIPRTPEEVDTAHDAVDKAVRGLCKRYSATRGVPGAEPLAGYSELYQAAWARVAEGKPFDPSYGRDLHNHVTSVAYNAARDALIASRAPFSARRSTILSLRRLDVEELEGMEAPDEGALAHYEDEDFCAAVRNRVEEIVGADEAGLAIELVSERGGVRNPKTGRTHREELAEATGFTVEELRREKERYRMKFQRDGALRQLWLNLDIRNRT